MSDRINQLFRLNRLLDEDQITESEYEQLKHELLNEPSTDDRLSTLAQRITKQDETGESEASSVDLLIHRDDVSDSELEKIWRQAPSWSRQVTRLEPGRYEWKCHVANLSDQPVDARTGIAPDAETSEQSIGEQMTDIAMDLLRRADRAVAGAEGHGRSPSFAEPPFQVQEVNLDGFAGYGIMAKFHDSFIPLIHISGIKVGGTSSFDQAMMFLLVFYVITGRTQDVQQLMQDHADRTTFRLLLEAAQARKT